MLCCTELKERVVAWKSQIMAWPNWPNGNPVHYLRETFIGSSPLLYKSGTDLASSRSYCAVCTRSSKPHQQWAATVDPTTASYVYYSGAPAMFIAFPAGHHSSFCKAFRSISNNRAVGKVEEKPLRYNALTRLPLPICRHQFRSLYSLIIIKKLVTRLLQISTLYLQESSNTSEWNPAIELIADMLNYKTPRRYVGKKDNVMRRMFVFRFSLLVSWLNV